MNQIIFNADELALLDVGGIDALRAQLAGT